MGLDNYFRFDAKPGETAPIVTIEPPAELCGGVFSGAADSSSFRGKGYDEFVKETTGISLYYDRIPYENVLHMADAIAAWIEENPGKRVHHSEYGYYIEHAEIVDLERVFRAYGTKEYTLVSWY